MAAGPSRPGPWGHRLAVVTAGATLLLIGAGGLVTSTGAGLAVPDWPTTFGRPMLLFPWSGMVGGVLVEHGHRLLGSAVGLLTLGLAGTLWATDGRGGIRALGALAVALVSVQGLLGGLRVVWRADTLAILHGCLAPLFFALVAALVVVTGPGGAAAPGDTPVTRGLAGTAAASAALVYGQVVLGALTVHGRWPGWVAVHVSGAVAVTVAVGVLAVRLAGRRQDPHLRRLGRAPQALLGLQVLLGLGAYAGRFTGLALPGGELAVIGLPVAHRVTGALLLGASVGLALRTAQRAPGSGAGRVPIALEPRGAAATGVSA